MKLRILACLLTMTAGLPVVAIAGPKFQPPKGCTGFLTVQMHGCIVSNHYTCPGDAQGVKWRVDLNQDGPFFVSKIDDETQWLETYDIGAKTHEVLVQPSVKPASFSQLIKTGRNDYDFITVTDDGKREHVTGYDKLTGVSKVVDGVKLEESEFVSQAVGDDGTLLWRSSGNEMISREMRIFLAGKGIWQDPNGKTPFDNMPVVMRTPGQTGFFAAQPEFDCNTVMSQLTLPPALEGVIQ
ncbi:hypothetical protein GALL_410840 [mine drainage metagenome]|uniref:Uncharacterized protein n=1 Tax=mine drainage metagenome TaxID=410659 RepID=A0A1J5Q0H8_9ZZZZ